MHSRVLDNAASNGPCAARLQKAVDQVRGNDPGDRYQQTFCLELIDNGLRRRWPTGRLARRLSEGGGRASDKANDQATTDSFAHILR